MEVVWSGDKQRINMRMVLGEAAEVGLGSSHHEPCMPSCDAGLFRAVTQSDLHLESLFLCGGWNEGKVSLSQENFWEGDTYPNEVI